MNERAPSIESEAAKPVEFEIVTGEKTRKLLKYLVSDLADRVIQENIEAIIFLDKSARPVSWLFQEIWRREHSNRKRPEIRFINVGRSTETHLDRTADSKPVSSHAVGEMRELFGTQFDGKKVLVVDEVIASGKTLLAAKQLVRDSFPTADVSSAFLARAEEVHYFPWMMIPGSTDVMELSESVVSHAVLEHRVRGVYEDLVSRIDRSFSLKKRGRVATDMWNRFKEVQGSLEPVLREWKDLAKSREVSKLISDRVRFVSEHFERAFTGPAGSDAQKFVDQFVGMALLQQLLLDLNKLYFSARSNEEENILHETQHEASIARSVLRSFFDDVGGGGFSRNHPSVDLATEAAAHADPARLAAIADQLRAEMKEIAKMPVSKK